MTHPRFAARIALLALGLSAGPAWPAAAQVVDEPFGPPTPVFLPLLGRAVDLRDLPPPPTAQATAAASATAAPSATEAPSATPPPSPKPSPAACGPLGERARITGSDLPAAFRANDEYFPLPLAPHPEGGSWVAWREQAGPRVRVGRFDGADRLVGTPLSFAAEEVHALVAHEDGGALVTVAEDPDIYSPKYCRGAATPDKALCGKLDLLRFDAKGAERWRRTMTKKLNVDRDGAHFIWWYQHTARLVWSGEHYGLYWRTAESSPRPGVPGEIDIHAADLLRFVDSEGNAVDQGGVRACSHSWAVRLAFGEVFASACHGDAYPNAFRLLTHNLDRPRGESKLLESLDPTRRALGGLVPREGGFWLLYMAQSASIMELRLAAVDLAGKVTRDQKLPFATGLPTAYPFRPYLAAYGQGRLLAGWQQAGALQLAVLDGGTGALLEGPAAAGGARIDLWSEFVSFPNGDVGWAWSPGGGRRLELVRVPGCG